jgi:membrane protein
MGRTLSLIALPAFLWFSTRLFAGIRISLNSIYDVSVRPQRIHFAKRILLAKLRDLGMVFMVLLLFLANTALSGGFTLLRSATESAGGRLGGLAGAILTIEGWIAEAVGFGFLVALFMLLYRFASTRRIRWQAALLASVFSAVAFELAKRLFALYLRNAGAFGVATVDATIGALILFVIWVYYSALVFLLGGVLAETWELRTLQRVQRGVL